MKKIFTIFLLLFSIQTVKAEEPMYTSRTKLYITTDNTMTYELNLSLNNEFMFKYDLNVEDIFNQESYKISLGDKGYVVDSLITNIGAGLRITKSYPDLKIISTSKKHNLDLTKIDDETFNDKIYFQKKAGLLNTKYIANFVFDYSNIKANKDIEEKDLKKLLNLTFEVNLPVEAEKYNASIINDEKNDLIWNLTPGVKNQVSFEFKKVNTTNLIVILIIGTIITIALIVLIVKKASGKIDEYKEMKPKKQKKEKKKKEKKNVFNNGMSNEVVEEAPIETIKEQTISLVANNTDTNQKIDLMASQSMLNANQQIEPSYNQQSNQNTTITPNIEPAYRNQTSDISNIQTQNSAYNQQPVNTPQNHIYNQQPVNAPQNHIYNQQPVNAPQPSNQNIQQNPLYNRQENIEANNTQPDYTSVFNQTFDDENK